MATKLKIKLPSITGLPGTSAAGTVGLLDLPKGYRYHAIECVYTDGGATPTAFNTMFGDVTLLVNTKVQRIHTAAQLDHANVLNGSQYGVQVIGTGATEVQCATIYFAEPWRSDKADRDSQAWSMDSTNGVNSFQLRMAIASGQTLPSTASFLFYAYVDSPIAPVNGKAQFVKKVYRQSFTAGGTGLDITTLDERDLYQTLQLTNPTGTYISSARVVVNGVRYLDDVTREANVGEMLQQGLNPANSTTAGAAGYDIVFDYDDPLNSALPASGATIVVHTDFAGAASGSVTGIIERLGPLD